MSVHERLGSGVTVLSRARVERPGAVGPLGPPTPNGLGEFLDRTVGHQPLQPTTSLMPPNVEPCGDIGLRSGLVQVRQQ